MESDRVCDAVATATLPELRFDRESATLSAMITTNPFPGMNPFIEQTWTDAHFRMIAGLLDELSAELPEELVASAEERVDVLAPSPGTPRTTRPDVAVVDITESWKHRLPPVWTSTEEAGPFSVTEPELMVVEEPPHRWVEIRVGSGELVTVIEILSPANKSSNRDAYRAKRREYVAARVNVVEIDLLRGGRHIVDANQYECESRYGHIGEHYLICASRGILPERREIYPCRLRERLPVIRIPLRATDPDVPLDIQALVDRCYTTGRYARKLDYTRRLLPPLSDGDTAWVKARLEEAGLRARVP